MQGYSKEPLVIKTKAPSGNYEVRLTITAHSDTVYSVYIQDRQFAVCDREIKSGEVQELTFPVSVHDKLYRNGNMYTPGGVVISIACDGDLTAVSAVSPKKMPTLYVIGDSTVTNQGAEYPYIPEQTYCGIAQPLLLFTDGEIAISNHAESGGTTKDAIEAHIKTFENEIGKGDFLMIEYGHNDQKIPLLSAFGGYTKNILYLINWARERGATPIVNSPINRIIFDEDGKIFDLLGDNKKAAQSAAEKTNAPFIDMWTATTALFEPLGLYTSKKYFRHDADSQDYTHPNDLGGMILSKICARLIKAAEIDGLSEHICGDLEQEKLVPEENVPFESNAFEFKRLKTLGIGTVPEDIDEDIS